MALFIDLNQIHHVFHIVGSILVLKAEQWNNNVKLTESISPLIGIQPSVFHHLRFCEFKMSRLGDFHSVL
jgi:hypothetical protein